MVREGKRKNVDILPSLAPPLQLAPKHSGRHDAARSVATLAPAAPSSPPHDTLTIAGQLACDSTACSIPLDAPSVLASIPCHSFGIMVL